MKLYYVCKGKNTIVCEKQNKIVCVARQVKQSANCASVRRLKIVLVDLTRDTVVHQAKPAENDKWIITLCWAPYMPSTMPINLYYQIH